MSKFKPWINILVICIGVLALGACIAGLFISGGSGQHDFITAIIGIQLLLISLYFTNKGSLRGKLMLTCISAMIINMALNGVDMSLVEILVFPIFNLLAVICLILLFKNTNKGPKIIKKT